MLGCAARSDSMGVGISGHAGGKQISTFESSGQPAAVFPFGGRDRAAGRLKREIMPTLQRDPPRHQAFEPPARYRRMRLDHHFGLAKADESGLTATGDMLGTLRYMAPERLRGAGDCRRDVDALGLTLYELLTLRPAFDAEDRLRLIEQIKEQDPPRPRAVDSRIERDLETLVLKAIDKDPRRRYQTAREMAEDLRRFLVGEPILRGRSASSSGSGNGR